MGGVVNPVSTRVFAGEEMAFLPERRVKRGWFSERGNPFHQANMGYDKLEKGMLLYHLGVSCR